VQAEAVGLDYFGIGEHHTPDMPLSAADVVLAAIAARTENIRLGSAVTVLSSDGRTWVPAPGGVCGRAKLPLSSRAAP
jgi:alkanesulfonate monooxygenase SsuD/methylene tetrahydromethanopterin reductase-like flavin-dependent oxidoreductase (luciferase family)